MALSLIWLALSLVLPLLQPVQAQRLRKVSITSTLNSVDGFKNNQLFKLLNNITSDSSSLLQRGILAPTDNQVLKVVASICAGNGQVFKQVLVDTGSGILWVGGEEPYQVGPNTKDINETFSIGYGIGGAQGKAYIDTVTIGEATAHSQIIGAASNTTGLALVKPIDGILGLGTSGSNLGQISGLNTTPTFVETLVAEGSIDEPVFGLYISPLQSDGGAPTGSGEIAFGGADPERYTGDITWLPQLPPLNFRWEFNVSGLSFGNVTLNQTAIGRTDSGVLGIALPTDQFFDILHTYNGTIQSGGPLSGFMSLPSPSPSLLHSVYPPLTLQLGQSTFSIPSEQYLVPKSLYAQLNLTDTGLAHTWFASGGFGAFNLGQKWLEGVYTVYDMGNHRIGFAHPKPQNPYLSF